MIKVLCVVTISAFMFLSVFTQNNNFQAQTGSSTASTFKEISNPSEAQAELDRVKSIFLQEWKKAKAQNGKVIRAYVAHEFPQGFTQPKEWETVSNVYCGLFVHENERWTIVSTYNFQWGPKLLIQTNDLTFQNRSYPLSIMQFNRHEFEAIGKSFYLLFFGGFKFSKADKIISWYQVPTIGLGADSMSDDYWETKKTHPFILEPIKEIFWEQVMNADPIISARINYFKADAELKTAKEAEKKKKP